MPNKDTTIEKEIKSLFEYQFHSQNFKRLAGIKDPNVHSALLGLCSDLAVLSSKLHILEEIIYSTMDKETIHKAFEKVMSSPWAKDTENNIDKAFQSFAEKENISYIKKSQNKGA